MTIFASAAMRGGDLTQLVEDAGGRWEETSVSILMEDSWVAEGVRLLLERTFAKAH